jgi:antitoxin HigA-1
MTRKLESVHPGEVLREDFLVPMKLSAFAVARAIGVPRTRIERLSRCETPVTADTALRLARYFRTTPTFWMGMQTQYDLETAEDGLTSALEGIVPESGDVAMSTTTLRAGSGQSGFKKAAARHGRLKEAAKRSKRG